MYCRFDLDGYQETPIELMVDLMPHLCVPTKIDIEKWVEEGKQAVARYYSKFYGELESCVVICNKHGFGVQLPNVLNDTEEASFMQKILERIDKIHVVPGAPVPPQDDYYNSKCNVHIPGNALIHIDDTLLLTDCCTDYLQEKINEGFRILAICPQPDQRRPDYILGRKT